MLRRIPYRGLVAASRLVCDKAARWRRLSLTLEYVGALVEDVAVLEVSQYGGSPDLAAWAAN